jgi:23S rRNA (uracil1939-C5)-methyltransferase
MSKRSRKNTIAGFKKLESQTKRGTELVPLLHSEHIVEIEKLVVGGDGLARLQYQDKSLVVFVPQTAPQEKVKIKITKVEKNHITGEILEVLIPSEARRVVPCEYFNSCGGCNWQHISETEQIYQKELILIDLFKKFLPDTKYSLFPSVKSDLNFNYRNRIQLKQQIGKLGYFKKSSHEIVDITSCLLAEKEISDQILNLKNSLKPSAELKKFELRINHLNKFEYYPIGEDGEGLSFSQVNSNVNEKLVDQTIKIIKKIKPQLITELYSGAGNFTFAIMKALNQVKIESVELNSKLTDFAKKIALDLKVENRLLTFTSDCENFVKKNKLSGELVILDPPRAGCPEEVVEQLLRSNTKNIIYISCHPVFLARDLKKIMAVKSDYKIEHLQIFDMFPQTDHFETLIWLKKA